MSYILDAIKKAEKQRQIERIPTLETALTAESRSSDRGLLGWVFMWLLVSILVALAIAYREPLALEVRSVATSAGQAFTNLGSVFSGAKDGEEVISAEKQAEETNTQSETDGQVAVDSVVNTSTATQPKVTGSVESAIVAPVELEVAISAISYSTNKDKRFIMSGPNILREGDRISGYEIREIRKQSVLLDVGGVPREVRP